MTKEKLALEVIKRLKTAYPRTDCTLEYDEAWKLLVSVRLAAQCTDARVNVVVVDLFKKYPSIEALAAAEVSDIEEIVPSVSFTRRYIFFILFLVTSIVYLLFILLLSRKSILQSLRNFVYYKIK